MIGWLVDALIASALLMAAALSLRLPVRRLFGPTVAYALWLLPALRLLLPPLPQSWSTAAPMDRPGELVVLVASFADELGGAAQSGVALDRPFVAVLAWGGGAGLFLIWQIVRYLRFRHVLLDRCTSVDRIDGVEVVLSPEADGPLACGVLRRLIVLPADFAGRFNRKERALALLHEVGHHRRGDLLANWIALVVLAVHWWNPIAWFAHRAFRTDQELANDAFVLASCPASDRADYARTIAKAALGGTWTPVCNLNSTSNLRRRLLMLARPLVSRRRSAVGAAATGLVAGLGIWATAAYAASSAPPAGGRQVTTIIVKPDGRGASTLLVDGADVALGSAPPNGAVLPSGFGLPAGCEKGSGAPQAFIIKGEEGERTYTVACARSAPTAAAGRPMAAREAYRQALAGLSTLRASVETQTPWNLPEAERGRIIAAIDASTAEIADRAAAAH